VVNSTLGKQSLNKLVKQIGTRRLFTNFMQPRTHSSEKSLIWLKPISQNGIKLFNIFISPLTNHSK